MIKVMLVSFCLLFYSSVFANPIIGMPTGSAGGTYYPMGKDIAKLTAQKGLVLDIKNSVGSLDNIRRMSSSENAGISIVQSDVIEFLNNTQSNINHSVLKNLSLIFPLYNEEVHLLARSNIKSISDLENKRVVVGKLGSGTYVTVNNILNKVAVNVIPIHDLLPEQAYQRLLVGTVDAVFFVGGKPLKYLTGLLEMKTDEKLSKYTDNIHLVPLDDARLSESYATGVITPEDYRSVDGTTRLTNVDVPTVAVRAILVSYDFSKGKSAYYKMRCGQIDLLNTVVRENLPLLASGGVGGQEFHPKWAQVDLDQPVDLPKTSCIKGLATKGDEMKQINCYLQTGNRCE